MKKHDNDVIAGVFTLDRIESDSAVIVDGQDQVVLPLRLLPKNAKEGDAICLSIATNEAERKRREKKAKDLLNEILRGE